MLDDRFVGPLADRLDVKVEEEVAHRGIADHHHFVDFVADDPKDLVHRLELVVQSVDHGLVQLALKSAGVV